MNKDFDMVEYVLSGKSSFYLVEDGDMYEYKITLAPEREEDSKKCWYIKIRNEFNQLEYVAYFFEDRKVLVGNLPVEHPKQPRIPLICRTDKRFTMIKEFVKHMPDLSMFMEFIPSPKMWDIWKAIVGPEAYNEAMKKYKEYKEKHQ